jgi:hypothetical protein
MIRIAGWRRQPAPLCFFFPPVRSDHQGDSFMDFNSMLANVRRAMSLDRTFYQEVAYNERYSQEALMVVIVAAVLTGIGGFLSGVLSGNFLGALIGLIVGVVLAVAGYYIWTYIVQYVGKAMFQGQATVPQLLRTLGYAYAPMALGVLSFIPCFGGLIAFIGSIWSLVCGFFAVRETHKLSDGQTIITVLVGWLVVAVISAIVGTVFGVGAFGLGALAGR